MDTPLNEKKSWKKGSERFEKYKIARQIGKTIAQAGAIAEYNLDYMYQAEQKYKKYSMTAPKLLKKAHKFVHYVLDAGLKGKEEYINPATTLTRDIYDRTEPKVQKIEQDNRSVSVEITADVSEWADTVLSLLGVKTLKKVVGNLEKPLEIEGKKAGLLPLPDDPEKA